MLLQKEQQGGEKQEQQREGEGQQEQELTEPLVEKDEQRGQKGEAEKKGQQQQKSRKQSVKGEEPMEGEPKEGEEPMEGEESKEGEAKEEDAAPPFVLPPAVQLIGPCLVSLFIFLLQGNMIDPSHCRSTGGNRCRSRCPFALDDWLSVILRPLIGSFIQAFGAFLTGSGWVGHLVGLTDFRISSFFVLPISTLIMAATVTILDKASLF